MEIFPVGNMMGSMSRCVYFLVLSTSFACVSVGEHRELNLSVGSRFDDHIANCNSCRLACTQANSPANRHNVHVRNVDFSTYFFFSYAYVQVTHKRNKKEFRMSTGNEDGLKKMLMLLAGKSIGLLTIDNDRGSMLLGSGRVRLLAKCSHEVSRNWSTVVDVRKMCYRRR